MKRTNIKIAISCLMCFMLLVSGCDRTDYQEAVKLYNAGEYKTAEDRFEKLGTYEKSLEYKKKCQFKQGEKAFENGLYDDAIAIFQEISDVPGLEKSKDYIKQCYEKKVQSAIDANDLVAAKKLIAEVKDKIDVTSFEQQCTYKEAMDLFQQKKYEEAKPLFDGIASYQDSQNYSKQCADFIKKATEYFMVYYAANESDEDYNNKLYSNGAGTVAFRSDPPFDEWVDNSGKYITYTIPQSAIHFRFTNNGEKTLKNPKVSILFDGVYLKDVYTPGWSGTNHLNGLGGWAGAKMSLENISPNEKIDNTFEMSEAYFSNGKSAQMKVTLTADNYKTQTYTVKLSID